YAKGRAVLAMVEAWLGEERFRDGLRLYLRRHEWGNATAADLYAALAEASGVREVAAVMNSFTDQTGVPLVGARCAPAGAAAPGIVLRQREYLTLERKEQSHKLWEIPACVLFEPGAGPAKQCALLDGEEGRIALGEPGPGPARCPALFYPNAGEAG